MPRTEIDDIFASKSASTGLTAAPSNVKGKAKAIVSPSEGTSRVDKKKKRKKKAISTSDDTLSRSTDPEGIVLVSSNAKRKRTEPETILDPSAPVKRVKSAAVEVSGRTAKNGAKKIVEDDKFRDSRGTGPRRKTDEGFSIYKEDELGIGDQGGDTSLCPFDCDCCF